MTINRDGQLPDTYQGVNPSQHPPNIIATRAPTSNDRRYKIGTLWVDKSNNASYQLTSVSGGSANWEVLGSATAAVSTITGDTGGALSPSSGNITIAGGSGVNTSGTGSTLTANLDASFLRQTTTTLSATDVKALRATPITVVAAQGAGTIIEFVGAQLKLTAGSEVFTESDDNLAIRFVDGTGAIVSETIESTGFIDQAADTYTNAIAKADNIIAASTGENAVLVLHNTGDGEIAGNASDDATLEVVVSYRVHTI
jgi:hypothetical protein